MGSFFREPGDSIAFLKRMQTALPICFGMNQHAWGEVGVGRGNAHHRAGWGRARGLAARWEWGGEWNVSSEVPGNGGVEQEKRWKEVTHVMEMPSSGRGRQKGSWLPHCCWALAPAGLRWATRPGKMSQTQEQVR